MKIKECHKDIESWVLYMSYDAFDRLVSNTHCRENSIVQHITYTYDKNSNRLHKGFSQTAGDTSNFVTKYFDYKINSLNQIIKVSEEEIYYDNNLHALPSIYKTKNINYNERGNLTEIEEDGVSTTFNYDEFDMLVSTNSASEHSIHTYDYRGRRVEHGFGNANKEYQTTYTYSDGTNVLETKLDMKSVSEKTTLFYRGSDQGGGVGGINYSEFANGDDLNYKFYNLRGDVIMSLYSNRNKSSTYYFEFGQNEQLSGDITTDRHRANTKVEDETNLLNDGKRFRHLELDIFLTPDPLEYVDGFNPYIYCNQNPWGRWDPEGLREETKEEKKNIKKMREFIKKNFSETKKNSKGKEVSTLTDEGSKMMHAVDMLQNDIKSVKDGEKDPANLAAALYAISKWATDSKEFTKAARHSGQTSSDGSFLSPSNAGDWKCNYFVASAYGSSEGADVGFSSAKNIHLSTGIPGFPVAKDRYGQWGPQANDFATVGNIRSFSSAREYGDGSKVKTGSVVAWKESMGSGHTGISIGNGIIISAGEKRISLKPLRNKDDYGRVTIYRNYTGSGK